MSSLDLTRDWLHTVTRPYAAREGLISQVLAILQFRRTLSVKTDAFTFDTGHTALLLLLHGTLPISYRGATYHIPVHIWIPHEYPRAAPLAFVVPTKDMGVRKGKEVEPSGRVNEEVVDQWWNSWPDRNIELLLQQLTAVFSAVPPVYARPPEQAPPPVNGSYSPVASTSSPVAGRPGPPPPPARPLGPPGIQTESLPQYRQAPTPPSHQPTPQFSHARQASGSYPRSPASPIHPGTSQSPPIPARPHQLPLRQSSQPPASPTGPVLPQRPYIPQPAGPGFGPAPPITAQQNGPVYAYDPSQGQHIMTPPRPTPPPQHSGFGPPPISNTDPRVSQPQQTPYPPNGNGYQSPPPAPSSVAASVAASIPASIPTQAKVIPRQAMQDLLSSPEQTTSSLPDPSSSNPGAPPPIPPSKPPPPSTLHLHSILLPHLTASLPPLIQSLQANRQHLLERQEDLQSGEPAIKDEMARLEAVKKVCDSVGRKMDEVVMKGEERVMELEQKGEISVDEVVCGISIVHNQLIDLVAEDNAIEDTIYHITRALDSERIDLDRFLKSIRSLAREQYLKRALIERILQGMGQTW